MTITETATNFETVDIEICADCMILHANGEVPPEMSGYDCNVWIGEIDRRWEPGSWTIAVGDGPASFSHMSCDSCGSHEGGDRYDATALRR